MNLKARINREVEVRRWGFPQIQGASNHLFAEGWSLTYGPDGGVDVQLHFRVPRGVRFARDADQQIIDCYEHPRRWQPHPWNPGPFPEETEVHLIAPTRVWISLGPEGTARGVWLAAENPPVWSS